MGRPRKLCAGQMRAYYTQPHHQAALEAYRLQHGYNSSSEALRAILDMVAESCGVDIPEGIKA